MSAFHGLFRGAVGLVTIAGLAAQAAAANKVDYNRDVRPILSDHCFACHGPDKKQRKADLRLDVRDAALAGGAILPGKVDESELVARILATDPDEVMPPPAARKPLSAAQVDILKRWVASGAPYAAHWSYTPIVRPPVPDPKDRSKVRNPIDAFVQADLEARRIAPAPEADRRTLIRRLSLDLIGLPPAPEEVRAFLDDKGPRAYENLVTRLMASTHYGERMATPWLDVVRYADTVGFHGDQNQNAWAYRDYVIDAFNQNLPFDRFTAEQLAGDLLPDPTPEQLTATCFNRLNMMTREGGPSPRSTWRSTPATASARSGWPGSGRRSAAASATTTSSIRSPPATSTPSPRSSAT
jgi:mono/diheme cytochrome c family protein